MYRLQTVLFNKDRYSLQQAVEFLATHKLKHSKVDETLNLYRFRQVSPAILRREGFTKYVSKPIADGITFVFAYSE